MTFNSWPFLFFLPMTLLLYWSLSRRLRWQNLFLVAASYVFYGWWDYRFLLLILVTTLSSYASALLLEQQTQRQSRRMTVEANLVLNLGILACFKYFNFFADTLQDMAASVGLSLDVPTLRLILPVGISFYTFQSLSYTIDVYRRKLPATRDIVAFMAYISFFPQLVAGPIERATDLLPQMLRQRRFDYDEAVDGLRQMLWGFFKKMVIADTCALAVNQIWDSWQEANSLTLFVGMLLFTFQIYCDFSGYSDIAIGTARLFGIRLSDNFRLPYFSRNVAEFWRRWHISLMTWFRDYLYIPLGGSRVSRLVTVRNIFIVFALSGLWHGANWTFVAWGLYSAVLLSLAVIRSSTKPSRHEALHRAKPATKPSLRDIPKVLLTFLLMAIGWVLFRSATIGEAVGYLTHMITSPVPLAPCPVGKLALLWCLLLLLVEWWQRDRRHVLQLPDNGLFRHRALRWMVYYLLILLIVLMHGEEQTFIYFQF